MHYKLTKQFHLALIIILLASLALTAQQAKTVWSTQEKPILEQLRTLRKLPDDERAHTTKRLALLIRQLPSVPNKLTLAHGLANLATEGDFGHDTLQEVTTTLADALRELPIPGKPNQPTDPYIVLAQLKRYEHMQVTLDAPQLTAAPSQLEADDHSRENIDFTLTDLEGKTWSMSDLRGKIVLVNFWATWCPPCRKEMPDLNALWERVQPQGLVILSISDEDMGKVKPFIAQHGFSYPILLDPGDKVHQLFRVEGIPKSFLYDRQGKFVTESIDMRTQKQFLEMLRQAGLE